MHDYRLRYLLEYPLLLAEKKILSTYSEQSRRDDIESIGYILVYFLRGSLPWQGLVADTKKKKYEAILAKKLATSAEMLCKGIPSEFVSYFNHVHSLRFDERPDYDYLKQLFRELFLKKGYAYDNAYDWVANEPRESEVYKEYPVDLEEDEARRQMGDDSDLEGSQY